MADPIFRLELGSESDFSGVLVGAGRTGGLTGTTAMSSTTTTGTIRIARPSTIAMRITAEGMADRKRLAGVWTGRLQPGGMYSTTPAVRRDRSRETIGRRAGTPHRVARAICAPAPLAITITAERRGATRREVARVLAVEAFMAAEHRTEAAAHTINLRRGALGARGRNWERRRAVCGTRRETSRIFDQV